MKAVTLLLAVIIPFPLCLFRMKKYKISLPKMLLIYFVVSTVGAFGAAFGSLISNESILSQRLYGLMLCDTILVFALSPLIKMRMSDFGDFIAVPIMAVCFSAKINCVIFGCCYGFNLYQVENHQWVKFPSAILEMLIWAVMTILLLRIERAGTAKGILWPIGMIWFGTARFLVDYLRGSVWERRIFLLGMTGGRFWSLVVLMMGIIYLYVAMMHITGEKPKGKIFLKAITGVFTTSNLVAE